MKNYKFVSLTFVAILFFVGFSSICRADKVREIQDDNASSIESSILIKNAWEALAIKNLDEVVLNVNKLIEKFSNRAKEMQYELTDYPWESKDKILSYWALNDVGTGYFLLGVAYENAGSKEEAAEAYKTLIEEYSFTQCWDPQGWFWKPAEAAKEKLAALKDGSK